METKGSNDSHATFDVYREPAKLRRTEKTPHISLGIDRVVEGRITRRRRVLYPSEPGTWAIPEDVVLHRWRRKNLADGVARQGFRLRPGTWRAVAKCATKIIWETASVDDVRKALDEVREEDPTLRHPKPEELLLLVRHLIARSVLQPILARHATVDPERPGIPDLFVYRREKDGHVSGGKFIEVKKPDEEVLPSQREEIFFLRSIGLKAGILRLIERWPRTKSQATP